MPSNEPVCESCQYMCVQYNILQFCRMILFILILTSVVTMYTGFVYPNTYFRCNSVPIPMLRQGGRVEAK